jgi:hypothetical protein
VVREGRRPSKTDRARAASAERDKARRPMPDTISADLQRQERGPIPWPRRTNERGFRQAVSAKCPECPQDSLNSLRWDGRRGYFVCGRCRGTYSLEDLGIEP